MVHFLNFLLNAYGYCLGAIIAAFFAYLVTKKAHIIDFFWPIGILSAIMATCLSPNMSLKAIIIIVFIAIWALRLATYFLYTRILTNHKDQRYLDLIKKSKTNTGGVAKQYFTQSFFQLFMVTSIYPLTLNLNISLTLLLNKKNRILSILILSLAFKPNLLVEIVSIMNLLPINKIE